KTIKLFDQKVDIGPHRFFSNDPRVNKLWLEVVGKDYRMVDRMTRIYYKGRFFHYPLKALDALGNLGIFEAFHCLMSYVLQRVGLGKRIDLSNFEGWVTSRFGYRLFEIFFKA